MDLKMPDFNNDNEKPSLKMPDFTEQNIKVNNLKIKFKNPKNIPLQDLGYLPNDVGMENESIVVMPNGFVMFKKSHDEINKELDILEMKDDEESQQQFAALAHSLALRKEIEKNRKALAVSNMKPGTGQKDYYKLLETPESKVVLDMFSLTVKPREWKDRDMKKYYPNRTSWNGRPIGKFNWTLKEEPTVGLSFFGLPLFKVGENTRNRLRPTPGRNCPDANFYH